MVILLYERLQQFSA